MCIIKKNKELNLKRPKKGTNGLANRLSFYDYFILFSMEYMHNLNKEN